ncbi:MAG: phage portal protein [Henriciella sp.]|nr:phage portal protein [Henriciella sp.]
MPVLNTAKSTALKRVRRRKASGERVPAKQAAIAESATGRGQIFGGWHPSLTPADQEHKYRGRDAAVARARDLERNEGLVVAGINRKLDMTVGQQGLRFTSQPDAEELGIDQEDADVLADQIERVWTDWAEDPLSRCDWEGDESWGGLCNLMARHYFRDNEAFAVLRWDDNPLYGFPLRTSLHVIDPDRVSNPNDAPDTENLIAGIETNGRHVTAIHVRNGHPNDWTLTGIDSFTWSRLPYRQPHGRPIVLHLRRKERAGERRGWSALMAILGRFKSLNMREEAEIQSALVHAMMAMVIYSDKKAGSIEDALDVDDMKKFADASSAYYGPNGPRMMDGTRISKLFPTERVEMVTASRNGGDMEAFTRVFVRHMASALDLTYEQLSMDYTGTNYSSARAGLIEVYRSVESFLDLFKAKIATPVLLSVLEDALMSGEIEAPEGVPDLYQRPMAWLKGEWLGPGRGWIDPVKEPTGAAIELENGMTTLQKVTARQGGHWKHNQIQQAREKRLRERLGLPEPKSLAEAAALAMGSEPEPEPQTQNEAA